MDFIIETLQKYKTHIETQGHSIHCIMLKGSQNYNLSDSNSDVNAHAIIIPSPSMLRANSTYDYEFEEGKVTCHDIFTFSENAAKGHPVFIELSHTSYRIGRDISFLKNFCVRPEALRDIMVKNAESMCNLSDTEKGLYSSLGYNPKKLSNILRFFDIIKYDAKLFSYSGPDAKRMLEIKRGALSKDEAISLANETMNMLVDIFEEKKARFVDQNVDYKTLNTIVLKHYTEKGE